MSVSIVNINELITPEKAGPPAFWSNMGAIEQHSCHNYKLSGTSACGDVPEVEALYLEIDAFDPVTYPKTTKTIELSPGNEMETWTSKDPRIQFTIYGDEALHNLLQLIESNRTRTFTNLVTSQDEVIKSMTIDPQPEGKLLQFKITLAFQDAEMVTRICCGSYYENAPFNECDGEGQTGEPNDDSACGSYEVSIAFTDDPDTLTASTIGGDDGVETFKWYKDGVFFGSGSAINPVLSGVYRVDAKKGNCSHSATFTYQIECEGFEVSAYQVLQPDGTALYIAIANLLSDFQWQEYIDDEWVDVSGETGISFSPDHTGTYRAKATTTAECEALSDEFSYTAPEDCSEVFTITLANVDETPTVTINDYEGEGTPVYEWLLDTGSGSALQPWTGATVPDAVPGYYTVIVNIDGCIQTATLLIQCEPTEGSGGELGCPTDFFQEFAGDDVLIAFNVTNFPLPDPAFWTAVQIESMLQVDRQGLALRYRATPTEISHYSIDYASQEIRLATGFPLAAVDTLGVRKINRT